MTAKDSWPQNNINQNPKNVLNTLMFFLAHPILLPGSMSSTPGQSSYPLPQLHPSVSHIFSTPFPSARYQLIHYLIPFSLHSTPWHLYSTQSALRSTSSHSRLLSYFIQLSPAFHFIHSSPNLLYLPYSTSLYSALHYILCTWAYLMFLGHYWRALIQEPFYLLRPLPTVICWVYSIISFSLPENFTPH